MICRKTYGRVPLLVSYICLLWWRNWCTDIKVIGRLRTRITPYAEGTCPFPWSISSGHRLKAWKECTICPLPESLQPSSYLKPNCDANGGWHTNYLNSTGRLRVNIFFDKYHWTSYFTKLTVFHWVEAYQGKEKQPSYHCTDGLQTFVVVIFC